jgi:hypothetical protein
VGVDQLLTRERGAELGPQAADVAACSSGRTSNLPVLSDALPTAIGAENAAERA